MTQILSWRSSTNCLCSLKGKLNNIPVHAHLSNLSWRFILFMDWKEKCILEHAHLWNVELALHSVHGPSVISLYMLNSEISSWHFILFMDHQYVHAQLWNFELALHSVHGPSVIKLISLYMLNHEISSWHFILFTEKKSIFWYMLTSEISSWQSDTDFTPGSSTRSTRCSSDLDLSRLYCGLHSFATSVGSSWIRLFLGACFSLLNVSGSMTGPSLDILWDGPFDWLFWSLVVEMLANLCNMESGRSISGIGACSSVADEPSFFVAFFKESVKNFCAFSKSPLKFVLRGRRMKLRWTTLPHRCWT